ncbi:MAG: hypothetical protein J6S09_09285 [Paludibacteraceae bacterium]|nr:hypothetical protein [Paludibacteraceae bacterium]
MNAIAFEINGKGTVFILYTQTLMNKIPFFSEESIPFYAAKIFGAEGVLCRRFVNFAIKRRLKQAEGVDYQRLPLGCVFS